MHNKIGFADIAPRFRQMPTSSYRPITLILLIRKMIIQMKMFMKLMLMKKEDYEDLDGWIIECDPVSISEHSPFTIGVM